MVRLELADTVSGVPRIVRKSCDCRRIFSVWAIRFTLSFCFFFILVLIALDLVVVVVIDPASTVEVSSRFLGGRNALIADMYYWSNERSKKAC